MRKANRGGKTNNENKKLLVLGGKPVCSYGNH